MAPLCSPPISSPDQIAELIRHFVNHRFIPALDHDPDDRLGPGRPDENAAGSTELLFKLAYRLGEILNRLYIDFCRSSHIF